MPQSKPRILFITKWYPHDDDPQNGIFIKHHAEAVSTFAEVGVIYLGNPRKEKTYIKSHANGISEIHIHGKSILKPLKNWSQKRRLFRKAIKQIFNGAKPDLVHAHVFAPDQLIGATYAMRQRIPFFITEHWSGFISGVYQKMPKAKKFSYKRLVKIADRVLAVSHFLAEAMSAQLNASVSVIPNILKTPSDDHHEKRTQFTFVVLADMVDFVKRISETITAFSEYVKSNPNDQLLLIGDGPDLENLKALAKEKLPQGSYEFTGRLPQPEAVAKMRSGHAVIVNSAYETFGVVPLEALAVGIPVLCSKCGGPEEILPPQGVTFFDTLSSQTIMDFKKEIDQKTEEIKEIDFSAYKLESIAHQFQLLYNQYL